MMLSTVKIVVFLTDESGVLSIGAIHRHRTTEVLKRKTCNIIFTCYSQ